MQKDFILNLLRTSLLEQWFKEPKLIRFFFVPSNKTAVEMIDNARPRIDRRNVKLLGEVGVNVTPWSSRSTNLNPIERMWDIKRRRHFAQSSADSGTVDLRSPNFLGLRCYMHKLILSMPGSVQKFIQPRGSRFVLALHAIKIYRKFYRFIPELRLFRINSKRFQVLIVTILIFLIIKSKD